MYEDNIGLDPRQCLTRRAFLQHLGHVKKTSVEALSASETTGSESDVFACRTLGTTRTRKGLNLDDTSGQRKREGKVCRKGPPTKRTRLCNKSGSSDMLKQLDDNGDLIELTKSVISFGRSNRSCDIIFDEVERFGTQPKKVLSRFHATISLEKRSASVVSSFGNKNNSETSSRSPINSGPEIFFFIIRDHGSLNGTYINGTRLVDNQPCALKDGDIIRFGPESKAFLNTLYFRFLLFETTNGSQVNDALKLSSPMAPTLSLSQPAFKTTMTKEVNSSFQQSSPGGDERTLSSCEGVYDSDNKSAMHNNNRITSESRTQYNALFNDIVSQAKRLCSKDSNCNSNSTNRMEVANSMIEALKKVTFKSNGIKSEISSNCNKTETLITPNDEAANTGELLRSAGGLSPLLESSNKVSLFGPLAISLVAKSNPCSIAPAPVSDSRNADNVLLKQLYGELSCSICCELFLYANTLCCGHSFCKHCIDTWLETSLTCPLCRCYLTKIPVQSHSIDKTIQVVLSSMSNLDLPGAMEEDLVAAVVNSTVENIEIEANFDDCKQNKQIQNFLARKRNYEAERLENLAQKKKLETLLEEAKSIGYSLVVIARPWSVREQRRFLVGVHTYRGLARIAYCESVNLSIDYINKATTDELVTAAENLNLRPLTGPHVTPEGVDVKYKEWAENDAGNVRNRLMMFVYYG